MRLSFKHTALLATLLMMVACATVRPVPVQTTTQVQTIIKDSLIYRTDTLTLEVPVESSVAYHVQSSHLETSVAFSDASIDTTGLLTHTIQNKPYKAQKEVVYVDKVRTEYRDSIQVREVPVEVEKVREVVPSWCWWLLALNILAIIALGVKLYLHFWK